MTIGTRALSFDQEELRNHVLLELEDISWLSVNVKGCTAHVQVVERKRPPEIVDREKRANVVAARAGLVTKVEALDGQAMVMAGSTVTEGQLLISGVAESKSGGVRFMQGRGRVYARTWYELSVRVPLAAEEKAGEGKTATRVALDVGKRRIKIYGKGSMLGASCDKITTNHPLTLPFGLRLPVTLEITVLAMIVSILIALPCSIVSVARRILEAATRPIARVRCMVKSTMRMRLRSFFSSFEMNLF